MSVCNVLSISGGKDSTAMIGLSIERKVENPIYVFADTGHEHPETYRYVDYLEQSLGITIHRLKADFSDRIAEKKSALTRHLLELDGMGRGNRRLKHYTAPMLERMINALEPTGVPFLDLCIWKGRFPGTRTRFCTQELKHEPLDEFMHGLFKRYKTVISWQGVRRDESQARRHLKMHDVEIGSWEPEPKGWLIYRPILEWTAQEVFAYHRKLGIRWNPLYEQGMGRVGCMPCIHSDKAEILEIAQRFPGEIARVAKWEKQVSEANKHEASTLLDARVTARFNNLGKSVHDISVETHGIHQYIEWAKTSRGGRQYDLIKSVDVTDEPAQCTSVYGLCE